MDELGLAFEAYRERVEPGGADTPQPLPTAEVAAWSRTARAHVEHAIRANRRADGLYHAYHVLDLEGAPEAARVQPLTLMLEGQVSVLDSGLLEAREAAELLEALFRSELYTPGRDTFLLYPDRELPDFLGTNRIPEEAARPITLLREMLAAGERTLVESDADGVLRFQGDLSSAADLHAALDRLAANPEWTPGVTRDRDALVSLFREVFEHRTFTGRSSRMVAYEGLGCVYWHMVAKLALAVQDLAHRAEARGETAAARDALVRAYFRIRGGLGPGRTVAEFGAFPTDPYSHTPARGGARQPGMTGQVKEEILARWGELGVRVRAGRVTFRPTLLSRSEFLARAAAFEVVDVSGATRTLTLPPGSLAFTYAQVPVVYTLGADRAGIRVTCSDGSVAESSSASLDAEQSRWLLSRAGRIVRIDVSVPGEQLLPGD
jgi:hypothetical protein